MVLPAVRLLQCEEYAALGNAAAAREAGCAVEAYRERSHEPGASRLAMGEAFGRYATAMALIGDLEEARAYRRPAIDGYRTDLSNRHRQDRLRFAALVEAYVADVTYTDPSDELLRDVIAILQDAAEVMMALIRPDPFATRDPDVQDHAAAIMRLVATQGQWFALLLDIEAAAVLAQRAPTLLKVAVPYWTDWLQQNREFVEERLADGEARY